MKYVVGEVSGKYTNSTKKLYYVHLENYEYILVFGSITESKGEANRFCKMMNRSIGKAK